MQSPLQTYHLDEPGTGRIETLGGLSYLWAGLFGPLYVLLKGCVGPALLMLAVSLGITLAAIMTFMAVASVMFRAESVIVLVLIPPGALFLQGVVAVRLVRAAYVRRGWREV
jgi:hypothetical protein